MTDCELCELQTSLINAGEDVDLGDGWRINVFQGESVRPRYVMQPVAHMDSMNALGPRRLAAMGRLMGRVERSLLEHRQVEKVYFEIYSETSPGHPHIHVIPRFVGETALGPSRDASFEAPSDFDPPRELSKMSRRRAAYSSAPLVLRALRITDWWTSHLSPALLFRRAEERSRRVDDFATTMVGTSLLVLLAGALVFSLSPVRDAMPALAAVIGLVGLWRVLDILMFVTTFVLGAGRDKLQHAARSVVMFVLNAVEIMLAGVVGLVALGVEPAEAWLAVASVLAPVDSVELGTWYANALITLVAVSVVALIATGIGLVVGKLGERVVDEEVIENPQELFGSKDH